MQPTRADVSPSRCSSWSSILLCLISLYMLFTAQADAQATRDFSTVEVKTIKLADNFHVLDFNGQGATIGVLTGPDGVLMVDAQFAPLANKIEAAIKQLSQQPIRYVINTHAHGDHTGGNAFFNQLGATIVARQQVRDSMAQRKQPGGGQSGLPTLVYNQDMALYFNGQEVRLIAVPDAHTNGDTLVHFPGLDIIVVGDLFRPMPYPHIDLANGGTLAGTISGLDMLIKLAGPNTKIVAGHGGPIADSATAIAQRDLILKVRERVAALVAQGKSEEEVIAARVTADLDARVPQTDITVDRFVREVYASLKGITKPAH